MRHFYEINDDYSKFKSYSLDPFPNCQMKKRITDNYRKRKNVLEPIKTIDCNGSVCETTRQRSDEYNEPLLLNTTKRWHSLETVRAVQEDQEQVGCEELIDKKSLGRNFIKSWLVGIFHSSNGLKSTTRNGSGLLLQQHQPPATIAAKLDKESIV